jgi:2,4-dienoyl-CoA reductase-like NADH-dependent reductase (Old Yellow Enzyme family)
MLFTQYNLKGRNIKNRIVFPPVVCMGWSKDAKVSQNHIEHYKAIAKGGVGLIITEATCITPTAKLAPTQLGMWSDEFIDGFSQIAKVCHDEGVPVMAQIHHGGIQSVSGQPVLPTEIKNADGTLKARELTIDEIKEIENQFVQAAVRVKKAGLDGIELHGAHGYLLSYFHSSNTNKRQDEYGGSIENRARLSVNVIKRIRKECGGDFIIGIRFGGASPSLEDCIALAKMFEEAGCDILHVSFGAPQRML